MEKIDLVEILKDCPTGMELDSPVWNNIVFEEIDCDNIVIFRKSIGAKVYLTQYGAVNNIDGNCVIFPKGKTTWEGFHRPFKDGDILFYKHKSNNIKYIFIYKRRVDMHYLLQYCGWFSEKPYLSEQFNAKERIPLYENDDIRFATEEEKEKLFKAIKDNGYQWNPETKTLEELFPYKIGTKVWTKSDKEHKYIHTIVGISRNSFGNLEYEIEEEKTGTVVHYPKDLLIPVTEEKPKFKAGDEIKQIGSDRHYIIKNIEFDRYILNNNQFIRFTDEHIYELVPNKLVKPKFKVGDKIRLKENHNYIYTITGIREEENKYECGGTFELRFSEQDNWELVPNKFDINTLIPFESRVLVRDNDYDEWKGAFWSHLRQKADIKYDTIRGVYRQCIPYNDDTKHLLGKTNDCDEYFKNWK